MNIAARHLAPLWTTHADGSLRNGGIEFVTAGGLGGDQLYAAFERITTCLADRVNYDASWRCSTHMHVNMLDFTINQVARFLMVYAACEPLLFAHAGQFRRSSNFCTPVAESIPFHKKLIARLYDDACAYRSTAQMCNKYTALNLLPLFGDGRVRPLGTVEFRGGRPMVTMEDLLLQANLLLAIKNYVREFKGTEDELLASMQEGVRSTVYAQGIGIGLNVGASELEDAMVHAWVLLKSYQNGMKYKPAKKSHGDQSWFDEGGEAPQLSSSREAALAALRRAGEAHMTATTAGTAHTGATTSAQIPVTRGRNDLAQALNDLGFYCSGVRDPMTVTIREPGEFIPRRQAPRFHDSWTALNDPDLSRSAKACLMRTALSDSASSYALTQANADRAALTWLLRDGTLRSIVGHEDSPIPTIIRAFTNKARDEGRVREECLTDLMRPADQPEVVWPIQLKTNYRHHLSEEEARMVYNNLNLQSSSSNFSIFHRLMNAKVRINNRERFLERCASIDIAESMRIALDRWDNSLPVTLAYFVLRYINGASVEWINHRDLSVYDRYVQVVQCFLQHRMTVPVLKGHHSISGKALLRLERSTEPACGFAISSRVYSRTRTTPTRVTATGYTIY